MPPPSPLPKYIWKILDSDPSPLPEGLPLSDLDRGDGFIHLSTPEQVGSDLPRFKAPERQVLTGSLAGARDMWSFLCRRPDALPSQDPSGMGGSPN